VANAHDDVVTEVQALFAESGYRRTLGMRIERGEGTEAVIECDVTPQYANTQGVAHGGLVSGLVDTAAGVAVKFAEGNPRLKLATVSLTINYHRPGRVGHVLRAVGRRVSGSGTPCCTVEVHDDEGQHIATGIATMRVPRQ